MFLAQHGIIGRAKGPADVIWSIGDSHTIKTNPTGSSYGPTPAANTVYQWDVANQNLYAIGATDILQTGSGANWGSIYPQIGIEYNEKTGRIPVFVTTGSSGANFASQGDDNDWSTAGNLYAPALAQCEAACAYLGVAGPKYILVGCGINDSRSADALATIETAINSLFSRLIAAFPSAIILITQIGKNEVEETSGPRIYPIRNYLRNVAINNANVHIAAYEGPLASSLDYDSDNLHLLQSGKNIIGEMHGRWWANAGYSKWARSIIACHFDDLSTTRKDLIEAWITGLGSAYFNLEQFYNLHTTVENNTFLDWAFLWVGNKVSSGFTANDCVSTNGSSSSWFVGFAPGRLVIGTTTNSFFGVKVKVNNSAAGGSSRNLFGAGNTNPTVTQYVVGQTTTPSVFYRHNDLTLSVHGSWTKIPDATYVSMARDAGTKYLFANGSQVASAAVASITPSLHYPVRVGAYNATGTIGNFIAVDIQYIIAGKHTGFAQSVYYAAAEALITGW